MLLIDRDRADGGQPGGPAEAAELRQTPARMREVLAGEQLRVGGGLLGKAQALKTVFKSKTIDALKNALRDALRTGVGVGADQVGVAGLSFLAEGQVLKKIEKF